MSLKAKAIVCHDTLQNGGWKIEDVLVRSPGEGELLIEMLATGICHSDILVGSMPKDMVPAFGAYPRVLGHEGSGYVKQVGPGVTVAKPGDAVLCSFAHCEECNMCKQDLQALCKDFSTLNTATGEAVFKLASSAGNAEADIAGVFFGQSSFASLSVVKQSSIFNVQDTVKSRAELALFSPLGCGVQTGSGTVTNVADANTKDSVCIIGLGGVGLSALMAAKLRGCQQIIGVDRVPSRLEMAKELGATDIINTTDASFQDSVLKLTDGHGPDIMIDTTGVPDLMEAGYQITRSRGKYIQVGIPPPDFDRKFGMANGSLFAGKWYIGAVEGWANPKQYLPEMISWYREKRFPVNKMVETYEAEDFEKALGDMHSGKTIKPVLLWGKIE